jgi:hypothetical protein
MRLFILKPTQASRMSEQARAKGDILALEWLLKA